MRGFPPHSGLRVDVLSEFNHLVIALSVGTPLCPYGIAYRRTYRSFTSRGFRKSLCIPLCEKVYSIHVHSGVSIQSAIVDLWKFQLVKSTLCLAGGGCSWCGRTRRSGRSFRGGARRRGKRRALFSGLPQLTSTLKPQTSILTLHPSTLNPQP